METPDDRPRLLRADGAARDLRRRHPGRAGHAVAAVRAPRRQRAGCACCIAAHRRPARASSRSTPRSRASRSPARARRRFGGAGLVAARRRARVPGPRRRSRRGSPRAGERPDAAGAPPAAPRWRSWSLGIGLHNLGEGLAIGSAYAVGALALGAFLVVGFAIHNTTEGLAIVAPLGRSRRPRLGRPSRALGLIAGGPADARRVDRRGRLQRRAGRVPVRRRRRARSPR